MFECSNKIENFGYIAFDLVLSPEYNTDFRTVYNLFDLFGDFGGLSEVILILSASLMAPISEHFFFIKAIQKLYLAKTVEEHLF